MLPVALRLHLSDDTTHRCSGGLNAEEGSAGASISDNEVCPIHSPRQYTSLLFARVMSRFFGVTGVGGETLGARLVELDPGTEHSRYSRYLRPCQAWLSRVPNSCSIQQTAWPGAWGCLFQHLPLHFERSPPPLAPERCFQGADPKSGSTLGS